MTSKIYHTFLGWSIILFVIGLFRYFILDELLQFALCLFVSMLFLTSGWVYFSFEKKNKILDPFLSKIHLWLAISSAIFFLLCYFESTSMFIPSRFYSEADLVYPDFSYKNQVLSLSITISAIVFGISFLLFCVNILNGLFNKQNR